MKPFNPPIIIQHLALRTKHNFASTLICFLPASLPVLKYNSDYSRVRFRISFVCLFPLKTRFKTDVLCFADLVEEQRHTMAGATNWLTFSLTPLEMLRSFDSQFLPHDNSSHCFIDNIYANHGNAISQNHSFKVLLNIREPFWWSNSKSAQSISEPTFLADLMDSQNENQPIAVPKMEEFFFDNQAETQDSSSLTQIYDQSSASAYFSDQRDLETIAGFQAFSAATNSGSELDDSASNKTQATAPGELAAHSVESSKGALSLNDVVAYGSDDKNKAIDAMEFDTPKKVAHTFGQRTSIYRGVTRHRWTGRYEAHLWDNSCRREGQVRKGRQGKLGLTTTSSVAPLCIEIYTYMNVVERLLLSESGYDKEEKAARAYDLAALKYWGPTATTNFPVSNYTKELEEMKHAGKQEFIASLRRKSSGFSRGASVYRGVTRHHQQGRWQARIGRVAGNKDLYLGTFGKFLASTLNTFGSCIIIATEEEAAEAYDIAAIKFRGANAVTNFEMSRYDMEAILKSSLPVGGAAKRLKLSQELEGSQQPQCSTVSSSINFSTIHPVASIPFDSTNTFYTHNFFNHFNPTNGGNSNAESAATMTNATTLTTLPAAPGFFIWPHQSY
ncbi:hypothetical protein VNO77_03382 [Canavalia gladiata]|uniref:AP2/ERF domain-containing protein n=1 Tax=Canavalia gladiata TaxID=3824 RepID=A0AAN9MV98_CANGL